MWVQCWGDIADNIGTRSMLSQMWQELSAELRVLYSDVQFHPEMNGELHPLQCECN